MFTILRITRCKISMAFPNHNVRSMQYMISARIEDQEVNGVPTEKGVRTTESFLECF